MQSKARLYEIVALLVMVAPLVARRHPECAGIGYMVAGQKLSPKSRAGRTWLLRTFRTGVGQSLNCKLISIAPW